MNCVKGTSDVKDGKAYGQGVFPDLVSRITILGPQFVFNGEKEMVALISLFQCKKCFEYWGALSTPFNAREGKSLCLQHEVRGDLKLEKAGSLPCFPCYQGLWSSSWRNLGAWYPKTFCLLQCGTVLAISTSALHAGHGQEVPDLVNWGFHAYSFPPRSGYSVLGKPVSWHVWLFQFIWDSVLKSVANEGEFCVSG